MSNRDSEPKTQVGSILAYCGQADTALRLLNVAVNQGYCGLSRADRNPMLASLKSRPEFAEIIAKSRQCQQRFQEHRRKVSGQ